MKFFLIVTLKINSSIKLILQFIFIFHLIIMDLMEVYILLYITAIPLAQSVRKCVSLLLQAFRVDASCVGAWILCTNCCGSLDLSALAASLARPSCNAALGVRMRWTRADWRASGRIAAPLDWCSSRCSSTCCLRPSGTTFADRWSFNKHLVQRFQRTLHRNLHCCRSSLDTSGALWAQEGRRDGIHPRVARAAREGGEGHCVRDYRPGWPVAPHQTHSRALRARRLRDASVLHLDASQEALPYWRAPGQRGPLAFRRARHHQQALLAHFRRTHVDSDRLGHKPGGAGASSGAHTFRYRIESMFALPFRLSPYLLNLINICMRVHKVQQLSIRTYVNIV